MAMQVNPSLSQAPSAAKKKFPKKTHAEKKKKGFPVTPKRMRGPEEATKLALKNRALVGVGMYKFGFNRLPSHYKEDVRALLMISLIHSAQYWDESKSTLSTYAISDMRRCKREVRELLDEIHIPSSTVRRIIQYLEWKKEDPEGSLRDFADAHELTIKEAKFAVRAIPVFLNSKHPVDGGRFFNGQVSNAAGEESTDFRAKKSVSTDEIELVMQAKMHPPTEADLAQKSAKRELHSMIDEAVNPIAQKVLRMRMNGHGKWEGMTLEEVGAEFGVCRERIRQIERDAKQKLRERYPERLRECLNAFCEEPRT